MITSSVTLAESRTLPKRGCCEKVAPFRTFRADRILDARLLEQDFRPQVLFKPIQAPAELLRADDPVIAKVAFSARIARWLKERYPNGREGGDGRYIVTFTVADPAWGSCRRCCSTAQRPRCWSRRGCARRCGEQSARDRPQSVATPSGQLPRKRSVHTLRQYELPHREPRGHARAPTGRIAAQRLTVGTRRLLTPSPPPVSHTSFLDCA